MAICDVCGNFDDGHIEAPTKMFPSTKTALPDYKPDLYYYWDAPLEEDYYWRDAFPNVDCMCEICFDIANEEKENNMGRPLMDIKDQLTPEEYKRVIHVLTPFTLGRRVDDQHHFRTIRAKLKRQLASLENNGWYLK